MQKVDIPLGVCKESCMYLESAMSDVCELLLEECFSPEQKQKLQECADVIAMAEATICNIVTECGHGDEFLSESITPEPIDSYPEPEDDLMNIPLE